MSRAEVIHDSMSEDYRYDECGGRSLSGDGRDGANIDVDFVIAWDWRDASRLRLEKYDKGEGLCCLLTR